ncbi:MerR family transcriptional regulator [Duganella sp. Root198D2]|nr:MULTISPECIES: MerR family transcriptional regulator [unclassified Duganella]KQV46175.1 MerR family transcriptional regulator [Duganella sp. Root336D2]KRB81821.1 MerR family transcriptional regulator [Duganella sp. Root198D2]
MQIGELAEATGLSRDTLRYYEKRGLLAARRSVNGYRDYPEEAADWLRYIRLAQALGFTLQEIEADLPLLLAPARDSAATAAALREALQGKLADIDRRIGGLQELRGELVRRLGAQMEECPMRAGAAVA